MARINIREQKKAWVRFPKKKLKRTKDQETHQRFLNTSQWRKLRKIHLNMFPFCVVCHAPGRVVDHIIPVTHGGSKIDQRNLQTMCDVDHNKKRHDEGRGIIEDSTMTTTGLIPSRNL